MNVISGNIPEQMLLPALLLLAAAAALIYMGGRIRRAESSAFSDAASGMLNEAGFHRAAGKYLPAGSGQYAVVAMELRNYRQLIQTFGSDNCDRAIAHLGRVLCAALGASEPSARINRNTFCFLLKNRQQEAIRTRLVRMQESANQFNLQRTIPYRLNLAFGVYLPEAEDASVAAMQEKALALLNDAQEEPRIRFGDRRTGTDAAGSWVMIEQMERSLENGDFVVYMQPKVRLGDSCIVGAEALVRWRHPQRGLLTPEMFVPLLEEYHLIDRLDRHLFEQVCRQMAAWKQAGCAPCPVSVNLSLETLRCDRFLEPYVHLIQQYRISPELIEFELSEPILFARSVNLRALVDEIHSYGFRCSLDHFGKSAIALHVLRELNIDTLKLDRSCFSSKNNSRSNRYIVEAILKITSQLQIHTVAEGIDNETQVQYLRQAGCDMIQGFFYFQPVPAEEFLSVAFRDGQLRYVEEKQSSQPVRQAAQSGSSHIVMFTLMENQDRVVFSDVFSPLLYGQLALPQASALFEHSELIHENDRRDFLQLLERCRKEEGWVNNSLRLYTNEERYEWLEVHMHREHIAGGESVISGTLVNMAGWKNEVTRWMDKANRDPLTGLYNREYFERTVSEALEKETLSSGAIIFFDLDDFKKVNDTLGHVAGDDVLCFIAKRLLGTFRHTDVVARYGGDEFVVFVGNIDRDVLEKRLSGLCDVLRRPYRNGKTEYMLSGSIGAAVFPDDGKSYQELLEHADAAAYVAKGQGKAQYVFYRAGMKKAR